MAEPSNHLVTNFTNKSHSTRAEQAHHLLSATKRPVVLDIRDRDDRNDVRIPGAIGLLRTDLERLIESVAPDKERTLIVYCSTGRRSTSVCKTLREMGYSDVRSLSGGLSRWQDAGFQCDRQKGLTPRQERRYNRHIILPEIGLEGQRKLLGSKVLLVGLGGLGSPIALYLAAAGVGKLGVVDADVVDESNLQRQIIHNTDRLGRPKIESARFAIQALNPDVEFVGYDVRFGPENAMQIAGNYDVLVDGTDNFSTRYLINDVAVALKKPFVHGAVFRFDGQATTFMPYEGPCYRCMYPEPPPAQLLPTPADKGLLGALPGVIGLVEASEVIKLVVGFGQTLIGRVLLYDALYTTFTEVSLRRNPKCPTCGADAKPELLEGYYSALAATGGQ
jgi:sulfur-carrier protein adenylyltransferase/sulfurtransferase